MHWLNTDRQYLKLSYHLIAEPVKNIWQKQGKNSGLLALQATTLATTRPWVLTSWSNLGLIFFVKILILWAFKKVTRCHFRAVIQFLTTLVKSYCSKIHKRGLNLLVFGPTSNFLRLLSFLEDIAAEKAPPGSTWSKKVTKNLVFVVDKKLIASRFEGIELEDERLVRSVSLLLGFQLFPVS